MRTPALHLASREDALRFLRGEIAEPQGLDKYRVRSDYVVEAIRAMESEGRRPYNADLQQSLTKDLLGRDISYSDAHNERGPLSLLIYCAQGYHRADQVKARNADLIARGYVPFTAEVVREAYDRKMILEHHSGRTARPRYVHGALYAMLPRSRTKALNPDGSLVRLVRAPA